MHKCNVESVIEISGIYKSYDNKEALKEVNLEISEK